MKAVRLHAFGGPEMLRYEDAPKPEPKPGEVLVRVQAAGLNPPDWYLRDGYRSLPPEWQPHPVFPLILGSDISGVVESVGEGATDFSPGDEVYAMVRFPADVLEGSKAYAEYVSVPVSELAPKPKGIAPVQAAAATKSRTRSNPFPMFPCRSPARRSSSTARGAASDIWPSSLRDGGALA